MTTKRKIALRKAQLASARKRQKGKHKKLKRTAAVVVVAGAMHAGTRGEKGRKRVGTIVGGAVGGVSGAAAGAYAGRKIAAKTYKPKKKK